MIALFIFLNQPSGTKGLQPSHSVIMRKLNDDYSCWPITSTVTGRLFKSQSFKEYPGHLILPPAG